MCGPMTTIGTIKQSGDKKALYHKLIYTTTTARVILCIVILRKGPEGRLRSDKQPGHIVL